jgi:hypothetical protein
MDADRQYIVETFIEADVTSGDGLKTCHASMGGVNGVDLDGGEVSPLEAAQRSVRVHERHHWLETFLRETAQWDPESIDGASAQCMVRSRVVIRSAEGKKPVGEFAFEEEIVVRMA